MRAHSMLWAPLVAAAALAFAASPGAAQEEGRRGRSEQYWIGVVAAPVPPALQAHLNREGGVMVEEVADNSPAAKAGLKKYDVLLKIGDTELTDPQSVIGAVANSDGSEIEITLLRGGEEQTVTAQPERRPAGGPFRPGPRRVMNREELQRLFDDPEGRRMFFFGPGMMMPGQGRRITLPEGSLSITKKEGEPAQIVYKKGDETYETTEDKLDELPEEVRGTVKQMLGQAEQGGLGGPQRGGDPRLWFDDPNDTMRRDMMRRMQEQIDELRRNFDDLRRQRPDRPRPEPPRERPERAQERGV